MLENEQNIFYAIFRNMSIVLQSPGKRKISQIRSMLYVPHLCFCTYRLCQEKCLQKFISDIATLGQWTSTVITLAPNVMLANIWQVFVYRLHVQCTTERSRMEIIDVIFLLLNKVC